MGVATPRLIWIFALVRPAGTRNTTATWWSPGSASAGSLMVVSTVRVSPGGSVKLVGDMVSHWEAA